MIPLLLMIVLGFHTLLDIGTTALVITPIVLLLQYFLARQDSQPLAVAEAN